MAEYAKVYKKMWNNDKFRTLSVDAKLLWIYILSNQHSNTIGIYVISKLYILSDLEWLSKRLGKPFGELLRKGLIYYFEDNRVLIIPSWFEHNKIDNPNQLKKAAAELSEIPQSIIRQIVNKGFAKGFAKGLPKGLQEGLPKGYTNPESESESESETETETTSMSNPTDVDRDVDLKKSQYKDIQEIYDFYIVQSERDPKLYKLTKLRKDKIKARLKDGFTKNDISKAVQAVLSDKFMQGENDRNTKYIDLEYICRSTEITEKWRNVFIEKGY